MTAFSNILSPISADLFFSDYYERKPLYIPRNGENKFVNLPGIDGFEELLWRHESKLKRILRVNHRGNYKQIPHHASGKDAFRWAIDSFGDGCTLILNGTDHLSKEVAEIARSIEEETNSKVAANAFLTPANSRGFLPHFDTHDVFIMQLEGEKHWHLYDQRENLPLDRQIYLIDQETVKDPSYKYVLSPGDLLYVPRGMLHGPFTKSQSSLHITMGYRPLRWRDYLIAMVDVIAESEPRLRESIRPSDNSPNSDDVEKIFSLLSLKSKSPYIQKLSLERVREKFVSQLRTLPGGHIRNLEASSMVNMDTKLLKRKGCVCNITETRETVRLQFPGIGLSSSDDLHPGCIEAPIMAGGAIRFIAGSDDVFTAKDLPGILTIDSKIDLLKKLVREGLLVVIERNVSQSCM